MPIYSYNKNFGKKLFFLIMIGAEVYGILIGIDFDYKVQANLFDTHLIINSNFTILKLYKRSNIFFWFIGRHVVQRILSR